MVNTMQLYLRQFSFFSLFGKCGKSVISIILTLSILFSFSISTYAADGSENINTIDMNVSANVTIDTTPNVDGGVVTEDIEIQKSVVSGQSGFNGFIQYVFPTPTDVVNERRLLAEVCLDDNFSIVSGHEYNLNFTWGYNINLSGYSCGLLRFYNNDGEIIKEQNLFVSNGIKPSTLYNVDISFIPDTKDLTSGYRCELVLIFVQGGYNSTSQAQRFYISPEIVLIDKDDDSGWFQKIINKINDVWESVKELANKIGVALGKLGDNILEGLKSLFIPEEGFFDAKKQEMETFLEDHFGVIFTAPNILITIIEKLLTVEVSEPIISFPKIQFDLLGTEYSLIDKEIHLNLSDFVGDGSPYHILYKFYRAFATGFLIVAFANYCKNKYDYLFGKDGEAV